MIIRHIDQLDQVLQFIKENNTLAYDIETTGLNVRTDTVIGFGISNSETGIYIVHKEWNGSKLVQVLPLETCRLILLKLRKKDLITFNGSFDLRFTKNYFNINLIDNLWADAMLAKHTVDEERPFRLKDIAEKLYGVEAKQEQENMKASIKANGGSPKEYYKADTDLMAMYCIADCKLTYNINKHYLDKIDSEGLTKFFFSEEVMPLYKEVTIPMEDHGIQLDMELLNSTNVEIQQDIESLESNILSMIDPHLDDFKKWFLRKDFPVRITGAFAQKVAEYYKLDLPRTKTGNYSMSASALDSLPPSPAKDFLDGAGYLPGKDIDAIQMQMFKETGQKSMFNLQSKHHLKKLFFETLGESPINRTEKGNPQCDIEFLESVRTKYEFVDRLLVLNKLHKIKGTYIDRFLDQNLEGIYYPSFFQHRTTSGRYGSDIQQLPRQYESLEGVDPLVFKYTNVVRDLIISRPGRKLIGADYSSLEVVVFADDAGDPSLINMIRNKEDFYSRVAIDVQGLEGYSADKKSDRYLKNHMPEVRQSSKVYSLGIRYGMQDFKLSKTLDIGKNAAKDIIKNYFLKYPKLRDRMEELRSQAKEKGFVTSKAGRIRHLPDLKKLHEKYGNIFEDALELWKKYNTNSKKYTQMKYLAKQYNGMLNNALNFPIQSMAASIVNRSSIEMMKDFKRLGIKANIIMSIHDETVVECEDGDADRVAKIMQDRMENTTKLDAPLEAVPEIGTRYGDIK